MKNKKLVFHFGLILLGALFYFVANFQRIAIPGAVFDVLQQELSVSAPYITAFGAIYMYIYAFNQLIIGVLVDRFGGLRVNMAGSIFLALGCLLFPITSNLPLMYFSRALIGLGSSTFYLSLIKELKAVFSDKNFGLAISVMLFLGYAGGIAANAPFVMAMKFVNWREILLGIAGVVVFAIIIFALLLPSINLPRINKTVKIRTLPFRLVLHKRHNRNLFSFACCNFGISYVIQTIIGKKFLEDFCVISSQKAAIVLSTMAIIAAAFNIINATTCKICHNHRVIFLKCASVITFLSLLTLCTLICFDIKSVAIYIIFFILAANASLTSLLVPVLHLTNRKMVSTTAVSIMNFCFFMMVGILGTATGFLLNIFEPQKVGDTLVYGNSSYLLLFGVFLAISLFEMYKAAKLSNKY
jgi:MFS family permease